MPASNGQPFQYWPTVARMASQLLVPCLPKLLLIWLAAVLFTEIFPTQSCCQQIDQSNNISSRWIRATIGLESRQPFVMAPCSPVYMLLTSIYC
jgi:hypothetical protein